MLDIQVAQPVEIVVTADEINREHELCLEGQKNAVEHAIRCGELLLVKKDELEHGEFMPWVMENCRFSYDTANDYMTVAAKLERAPILDPTSATSFRLEAPTSVRAALRKIAADNPKPKAEPELKREVAFSWHKHEAVLYGDECEAGVDAEIAALSNAQRDRKVAKDILYHLGERLIARGKQAIKASERL